MFLKQLSFFKIPLTCPASADAQMDKRMTKDDKRKRGNMMQSTMKLHGMGSKKTTLEGLSKRYSPEVSQKISP